jgi:hypothetical protein
MAERCIKCDGASSPYCLGCSSKMVVETIMRLTREVASLKRRLGRARSVPLKKSAKRAANG